MPAAPLVVPRAGSASSGTASAPHPTTPTPDLEVVIPAFNEERRLPRTVAATLDFLADRPHRSEVLVVDNGSVDHTVEIGRAFAGAAVPVRVIGCARRGKGAAVARGLAASRGAVVGFMDADLATPLAALDAVMELVANDVADMVIGSRYAPGAELVARQPRVRRIGGLVFRAAVDAIVPGFHDTQCGFKFMRGDVARAFAPRLQLDGFAFDVELLGRARAAGLRIAELPVAWTDQDGSTLSPVTDGLRAAAELLQARAALRSAW